MSDTDADASARRGASADEDDSVPPAETLRTGAWNLLLIPGLTLLIARRAVAVPDIISLLVVMGVTTQVRNRHIDAPLE
jgi:hypothetical protein